MNQFPQTPEYSNRAISNFFENSRRYSQLNVHHRSPVVLVRKVTASVVDTSAKFVTDVVDTGMILDTSVIYFATGVIDTGSTT
jgi:hypothetical protein